MVPREDELLQAMDKEYAKLRTFITDAGAAGRRFAAVERETWTGMLGLGLRMLEVYVKSQGDGDVGEQLELPDGRVVKRLERPTTRRLATIFGELSITRRAYGVRAKQRYEAIPLDARLELPSGEFSPLVREWSQRFCVNNSFAETKSLFAHCWGLEISVDSLEQMNRTLAEEVPAFEAAQAPPSGETEGELQVLMADGKGIPMRGSRERAGVPESGGGKPREKKSQKRVAYVGCSYTVDRHPRDANQVVKGLFSECPETPDRPIPQHKRIHGELGEEPREGRDALFDWLSEELAKRSPKVKGPVLFLSDGEPILERLARERFGDLVAILDLAHVVSRLWDVSYCFHAEGSAEAKEFVTRYLARLLCGNVKYVIRGIRQKCTKHKLKGTKRKTVLSAMHYFEANQHRMEYDVYLDAGYPIGTGPVEGACRNLIKDRFECSGMRWSLPGARAMLATRTAWINDQWTDFCAFYNQREVERLYPYRKTVMDLWN